MIQNSVIQSTNIMMRNLFIAVSFFIFSNAWACDICGCSSGGLSGGLFPQFQNNLLGLRYSPTVFSHPQNPGNFNGLSKLSKDSYHDSEVFFRWFPKKNLQLWINVPYKIRIREESLRTTQIQGIGDIQISGLYTFLRRDSSHYTFSHLVLGGGGISLPTGKYQQRDETLTMLPVGFQVGTGSWSAFVNALYMIRLKQWGFIAQGDFRTYSENERSFKKGNLSGFQGSFFKQFQIGSKTGLFIHAGLRNELLEMDVDFGSRKTDSGSFSNWATFTADIFMGSALMSFQAQFPVYSQYNGNQPLPGNRFSLSLAWLW